MLERAPHHRESELVPGDLVLGDQLHLQALKARRDVGVEELRAEGLLDAARRDDARTLLAEAATGRRIEWAASTVTQGEVLAAFADHCGRELEEVVVESFEPTVLVVRWRREASRFELRNGFLGVEGIVSDTPTMLLGDTEDEDASLVSLFLDRPDETLRAIVGFLRAAIPASR